MATVPIPVMTEHNPPKTTFWTSLRQQNKPDNRPHFGHLTPSHWRPFEHNVFRFFKQLRVFRVSLSRTTFYPAAAGRHRDTEKSGLRVIGETLCRTVPLEGLSAFGGLSSVATVPIPVMTEHNPPKTTFWTSLRQQNKPDNRPILDTRLRDFRALLNIMLFASPAFSNFRTSAL